MRLYFDSSVYGFIERNFDDLFAVKSWLKREGHDLCVSDDANVGEILGTPDPTIRGRLLAIVTRLGHLSEPPSDVISAKEFLGEVARCRPDWIRSYPNVRLLSESLKRQRRRFWSQLKANPFGFSGEATSSRSPLSSVLGENRMLMRKRRDERAGGSRMYDDLNLVTREQMQASWELFLVSGPGDHPTAEVQWMRACLDLGKVFAQGGADWRDFWHGEVDVSRMPQNYFGAVFVYCLTDADIGNTIDWIHACYLLTADRVVTADTKFFEHMVCARDIVMTSGLPVWIDQRTGPPHAELIRTLR